jgi:hypothetical protein
MLQFFNSICPAAKILRVWLESALDVGVVLSVFPNEVMT